MTDRTAIAKPTGGKDPTHTSRPPAAEACRSVAGAPNSPAPASPLGPPTPRLPASEAPNLLRRLPAPLLQPSLVLQLQRSQGNHHVARALAQRGATTPVQTSSEHRQAVVARVDAAPAPDAAETEWLDADMPVPTLVSRPAMDQAMAQAILTESYGTLKEIVPGKAVLLRDQEAMWKRCDKVHKGHPNPANDNQPWTDGDAEKYHPGLAGFAHEGTIYVNKQSQLATVTAHEILHLNTAAGFEAAVGEPFYEGATEYLAREALTAAGISLAGPSAYTDAWIFVTKLTLVVDKEILTNAYFKGADILIDRFDALNGAGAFAALRSATDMRDWIDAELLLQPALAP